VRGRGVHVDDGQRGGLGDEGRRDARAGQRELPGREHPYAAPLRGRAGESRGHAVLGVRARGPAVHRRRPEVFLGFSDDAIVNLLFLPSRVREFVFHVMVVCGAGCSL